MCSQFARQPRWKRWPQLSIPASRTGRLLETVSKTVRSFSHCFFLGRMPICTKGHGRVSTDISCHLALRENALEDVRQKLTYVLDIFPSSSSRSREEHCTETYYHSIDTDPQEAQDKQQNSPYDSEIHLDRKSQRI